MSSVRSACALVCPVSCVSRHRVLSVVEGTSRAAQRAHLGPLDLPAQDAGRARGEDRLQRAITLQVVGGGPTGCAPRERICALPLTDPRREAWMGAMSVQVTIWAAHPLSSRHRSRVELSMKHGHTRCSFRARKVRERRL